MKVRVSTVDTDFEDRRRGEVKDYLRRKFTHVASIATYGIFSNKGVIRDAARVFCIPLDEVNVMLKSIDTYEEYLTSPNTAAFRSRYPEVEVLADQLRGRIRNTGMHAAGVVVSKEPLSNYAPIETAKDPNDASGDRLPIVAMDMNEAADLGLIKLDILGLKCLSILSDSIKMIKERHGVDIVLKDLPLDDSKVYETISSGGTKGVFQVEAVPYTNLINKIGGVKTFDELAATNALVRPGAMNSIGPDYLARKNGEEESVPIHEDTAWFTEKTYHLCIYQEQVMLYMTELAGMSMSDANKVRKIIGKKKDVTEFEAYKAMFIEGASKKVSVKVAEKLWHDFEMHASYSFNLSHSVAYSMLSYYTAYLKTYYPLEFMYAMLKNEGDKDSRTDYLLEAKRLGIKVKLPHVNYSSNDFSIDGDSIRFGLSNIKFISDKLSDRLMDHRPFRDYEHLKTVVLTKGSGLNTRVLSALNAVGGATFPDNPKTGKERENFYEYLNIPAFQSEDLPDGVKAQFRPLDEYSGKGCFPVLGMVKSIKKGTGWSRIELVDESGSAGIFHSENTTIEPGNMYAILVSENRVARFVTADELKRDSDNTFVRFLFKKQLSNIPEGCYCVISFRKHKTKAGKLMAYIILSDSEKNLLSVMAFPNTYQKALASCIEGRVVKATLNETDSGSLSIFSVEKFRG